MGFNQNGQVNTSDETGSNQETSPNDQDEPPIVLPTDTYKADKATEKLSLGYIRLDSLMALSSFGVKMEKNLRKSAEKKDKAIQKRYANLEKEAQVLSEAAPSLSESEFNNAQLDFERIRQDFLAFEQQTNNEFAKEQSNASIVYKKLLDTAVKRLQSELKLDLIFIYETNLLYGNEALDLTVRAAKIMNSLPTPK